MHELVHISRLESVGGLVDTLGMTDPNCPRCASRSIPIVYGLPSMELFEKADAGFVALGGCDLTDEAPEWRCSGIDCGCEFVAPVMKR